MCVCIFYSKILRGREKQKFRSMRIFFKLFSPRRSNASKIKVDNFKAIIYYHQINIVFIYAIRLFRFVLFFCMSDLAVFTNKNKKKIHYFFLVFTIKINWFVPLFMTDFQLFIILPICFAL